MHAILPLLFASVLGAAPQFDVQLLDGSRVSGSLTSWDGTQVKLNSASGSSVLAVDKLASIAAHSPPAAPAVKPAVWIDLIDGSQLAAGDYAVEKGRAKIAFSTSDSLELPTAEIDAVRFQVPTEAAALEWSRLRGKKVRGDVLVTGNANAIDFHPGVIDDVTDQKVRFTLDGKSEALAVKRAKIFGLIYFHATAGAVPESPFTIVDAAGSRWAAASLKLGEGKIEFTSPGGRATTLALDRIAKIDLSCGKIVYVSDLKADSETVAPEPFTLTEKELASRLVFMRVRRDENLEAKGLRTHGQEYRKGLALHSRSQLAWTLPGKFSRLEGVAGIDEEVRPLGNVRVQILGDGKALWDAKVAGSDKEARPLSLDVTGVRRLVLIVESQGNFGAGDQLDLGSLRLIK